MAWSSWKNRIRARRRGFTLIEGALTTVIVGVGVLAIVAAQQAYHQKNGYAQRMGTALLLANELRELTLSLPTHDPITGQSTWGPEANEPGLIQYDDLDDFDGPNGEGLTFTPPISALRETIPDLAGWSQQVQVENVLPGFINAATPAPDNSTKLMRITVIVRYQGPNDPAPGEVTRLTWVTAGGV